MATPRKQTPPATPEAAAKRELADLETMRADLLDQLDGDRGPAAAGALLKVLARRAELLAQLAPKAKGSPVDEVRAKRAARRAKAQGREHPAVPDVSGG